ncbi:hypothetical protein F66182_7503 [Fusarium sp. NRRL 66182]|nr:hypothetical protein F66182_7503 [Fusarium sp. NRRL 66182]
MHQIVQPSLWDQAFDALSSEDKSLLDLHHDPSPPLPSLVIQTVEDKKQDCEDKQWVLYTNNAGEKVKVRDTLTAVSNWLEKFMQVGDTAVQQSSFKRIMKSTYHTTKSVAEAPMLSIQKQEEELFKLVSLVQNEVQGVKLDDIIDKLKQSLEKSHVSLRERRRQLSAWVNGIDTKNTYDAALQYRHGGTCEWAIKLPEFRAWASSNNNNQARLLWIHGPPGFGKTFMSARIIQHLKAQENLRLSYFFCVADNQLTRDPYAILRSWLMQLLEDDDEVLSIISSTRRSLNMEQTLTHLGMWELFVAVGEAVEGCTFVIDGFDECTDIDTGAQYHRNDPRNLFLSDLVKHLSKTKSRVLLVSRDVPDIRECLGQDVSCETDGFMRAEYSITAKDTSEDVQSFSECMIDRKLHKKKQDLRHDIASRAAKRSEGMFLWIKLLEQKISPAQNAKELKKTVTEMPAGISDAYTSELERIAGLSPGDKEKAVMILRWTLFAIVPLKVKQLAEALLVSDDDLEEYPDDALPDDWSEGFVDDDYVKERILGRCGSLLQIRASSTGIELADHTVHFVHFSVKEYLSNLSNNASLSEWATKLGLAGTAAEETRLSNICLGYLSLDKFKDIPPDTRLYPFLSYAAWAWYFHSFHEKPLPSQHIMHRTQQAFDPATSGWKVWTPLMEAKLIEPELDEYRDDDASWFSSDSELDLKHYSKVVVRSVQTPMYYASLLGLVDIVKWLEDQGLDYGCAGGRFGFPLQAAVARDHEELVKYLLNRHVDASQRGGQYGASIIAGAALAAPAVVRMLLAAKADTRAVDFSGWTCLHHACKRGNVPIVQLLLDQDVDTNAVTGDSWTPAGLACWFGHEAVLSILIQKGADLQPAAGVAIPPLQAAIENGNPELVGLLLRNGVSPNSILQDGKSALTLAVRSPDLVKKLLEMGADPDKPDGKDWNPLESAAALGNMATIMSLINAGAAVVYDHDSGTGVNSALQVAIANSHISLAKLLFEHGASLEQRTKGGLTALLVAVKKRELAAAEWLLDVGASMQCVWEHQQASLFDIAVNNCDTDMARLLARRGCFHIQACHDEKPPTAMQPHHDDSLVMLAFDGRSQLIRDRLSKTRDPLPNHLLSEALHTASARGHLSSAELLLKGGARAGSRDVNGRTALHHATNHSHLHVADYLLEHGASISREDAIGSTPIDLALRYGLKAREFIKRHMEDLTLHISRRPSLLEAARHKSGNSSAPEVREAISGSWSGHYAYLSWFDGRKDEFSITIPPVPSRGSQATAFSNTGLDVAGAFEFHGFVDSSGTVWFVKLYRRQGWLYRGRVDAHDGSMQGTWGSNRRLWFGTFQLEMKKD